MNIFDIILVPMGWILRFAYSLTNNYLVSILLFVLVIEVLCLPLQIKQQKNQINQAKLQPKIRAITKKYDGRKDNASLQKKQQEIQALYQEENFNPMGGCLPLLIQLPIIFCLYSVITSPLRYISNVSSDVISTLSTKIAEELGNSRITQIDVIKHLQSSGIENYTGEGLLDADTLLPQFDFFGFDLSIVPGYSPSWYWIIPVLVFLSSYLSTKIMKLFTYQAPESADAQNSTGMKIMNVSMPLLSAWISLSMPVAIGCYWIFRTVLSIGERFILSKAMPIPHFTEEELREAERQYNSKNKKKKHYDEVSHNRPPVKSLHRIDFDDEPLPPPVPEIEEEDEPEVSATDTPISKAPLKSDKKENE